MKAIIVFLSLIISSTGFGNLCASEASVNKIPENPKVGIISALPEPYGLFYQNRMVYVQGKNYISLFPKTSDVLFNANKILLENLLGQLKKSLPDNQFINLGSVDPEKQITGYFIEGSWGSDAKAIQLKTADSIINKNNLDVLIVIAPATYHIPKFKGEGTGLAVFYKSNKEAYAYASYTIKVYKKDGHTLPSQKQVFMTPILFSQDPDLKNKRYPKENLIVLREWVKSKLVPKFSNQITCLLYPDFENCSKAFPKPKKPLLYGMKL